MAVARETLFLIKIYEFHSFDRNCQTTTIFLQYKITFNDINMGIIVVLLIFLPLIMWILDNIWSVIFWLVLIFGVFAWIIAKLTPTRYYTKNCPWGYHKYGCQPNCPLHEHCWGPHPKSNQTTHNNNSFAFDNDSSQSSLPDIPTFQNEDGDWRTTYMDDTRYDDREYDERHDDDRFDNGGW